MTWALMYINLLETGANLKLGLLCKSKTINPEAHFNGGNRYTGLPVLHPTQTPCVWNFVPSGLPIQVNQDKCKELKDVWWQIMLSI